MSAMKTAEQQNEANALKGDERKEIP